MNKSLKIGLITTAVALPAYLGLRLYLRNKDYKAAESRFKEDDTEKKLIIMQILINKGIDPSESNVNSYLNYTVKELKAMLNVNLTSFAPSLDGGGTGTDDSPDSYLEYYSGTNYTGPGDELYNTYYSV